MTVSVGGHDRSALLVASTQPAEMRRRNLSAVLRAILAQEPISRSEIARITGLSAGTVTKLAAPLVAAGLLKNGGQVSSRGDVGRPGVPLAIDASSRAVIGMHIGLMRTTVGLIDLRGELLSQAVLEHVGSDRSAAALLEQAEPAVADLVRNSERRSILGLGASVGGWVDRSDATVIEHPALGWTAVPLASMIQERIPVPVLVDSSFRAHALAEAWFGAGTGVRSMVHLFVGNVVGAALVIDRLIHYGPRSASGQLTHFPLEGVQGARCSCGKRNCLQTVGSDVGMLTTGIEKGLIPDGEILGSLVARARTGDRSAGKLLRDRARQVGQVVSAIFQMINPEIVVLAGGILEAPEYLGDLRREVERRCHVDVDATLRVVTTSLPSHSLVLSSAALFLDEFYNDPIKYEPVLGIESRVS